MVHILAGVGEPRGHRLGVIRRRGLARPVHCLVQIIKELQLVGASCHKRVELMPVQDLILGHLAAVLILQQVLQDVAALIHGGLPVKPSRINHLVRHVDLLLLDQVAHQ